MYIIMIINDAIFKSLQGLPFSLLDAKLSFISFVRKERLVSSIYISLSDTAVKRIDQDIILYFKLDSKHSNNGVCFRRASFKVDTDDAGI